MIAFSPARSAEYTRRKAVVLGEAVDGWLHDHRESQDCLNLEDLIRDINAHRAELHQLDERIQEAYCSGEPFDPGLDDSLRTMFRYCLEMFRRANRLIQQFVATGYAVAGADELRGGLRLLAAMESPAAIENARAAEDAEDAYRAGSTFAMAD